MLGGVQLSFFISLGLVAAVDPLALAPQPPGRHIRGGWRCVTVTVCFLSCHKVGRSWGIGRGLHPSPGCIVHTGGSSSSSLRSRASVARSGAVGVAGAGAVVLTGGSASSSLESRASETGAGAVASASVTAGGSVPSLLRSKASWLVFGAAVMEGAGTGAWLVVGGPTSSLPWSRASWTVTGAGTVAIAGLGLPFPLRDPRSTLTVAGACAWERGGGVSTGSA